MNRTRMVLNVGFVLLLLITALLPPAFGQLPRQPVPKTPGLPDRLDRPPMPTCTIAGRVTDKSGNPVPGVDIVFTLADSPQTKAGAVSTDGGGRFRKEGLQERAGGYRVIPSLGAYKFSPSSTDVKGSSDSVNFVMDK